MSEPVVMIHQCGDIARGWIQRDPEIAWACVERGGPVDFVVVVAAPVDAVDG